MNAMTNHLQVELIVTALNYPVTRKVFDIIVTKDSISIEEARGEVAPQRGEQRKKPKQTSSPLVAQRG